MPELQLRIELLKLGGCYKVTGAYNLHRYLGFYFPKDTRSLVPSAPGKIFLLISFLFYMTKTLEQNVESELEDSSSENETAAERSSRDRQADAIREVICDVTHVK